MNAFLQRYASRVIGAVSGFDRILFRGTLRFLAHAGGLMHYLWNQKVLLKNFGDWSQDLTQQIRAQSEQVAHDAGRPVRYVNNSSLSKEQIATEIAEADGIKNGLVCVLTAVEPCQSYEVHRNRANRKLELVNRSRKCLHLYHYHMHEQFGLMHMRVQTWLPFGVRVCLNGRSWLARQMDQAGIDYVQRDNCFTRIGDVPAAQRLLDEQLKTHWPTVLDELAVAASPARSKLLRMHGEPLEYYWSADQTELATDVMFDTTKALQEVYGSLVRQGVLTMGANDVLRFLGKKPDGRFAGTASTDLKLRSQGLRIKHTVNGNSVKMYDKQKTVLRVETTINDPSQFKVFRGTEANPQDREWRQLRKGVADLHRRAEVSQGSNDRYLSHLAAAECPQTVEQLLMPLSKRITREGRPYRGLRVMERQDADLLAAVADGKFAIYGFRNADIRQKLFGDASKKEQRKQSGRVSRKLGLLKAHGLIRRVPRTRRWMLTEAGEQAATLLAAARSASAPALLKTAA